MNRHVLMVVCLCFASCLCRAQAAPSSPLPDNPGVQSPDSSKEETRKENGKLFGIMPNFGTVNNSSQVQPMTTGDKFRLALRYFDPYTFVFVGLRAGIEQAANSKEDYGQGAQGYGKRYGADFADGLSNSIFVNGVFPSLFRQDPRYFRRGVGSGSSRLGYAISRVLITRQDSGHTAFNFSEVLGNAASSGLSTAYYPDRQRTAGDFAERAGVQFGFDAGFDLVKEFYPDLARKFRKKTKSPTQPAAR